MFASVAHAMGAGGGSGGSGDALMQFMPLILMLAIFYFLLIRPQQKRAKEHKGMLQALKKGDTVITNAGFIARIIDIDEDILTVDLGTTTVQLGRAYVAGLSNAKFFKPAGRKESRKEARDAEDDFGDEAETGDVAPKASRAPAQATGSSSSKLFKPAGRKRTRKDSRDAEQDDSGAEASNAPRDPDNVDKV